MDLIMQMNITEIPKILHRTYGFPWNTIPERISKVIDNAAKGWILNNNDDVDCAKFIRTYYGEFVLDAFHRLTGAHRADLWRYCVLYYYGGVYLDIKTVPLFCLDELFPSSGDKFTWYTVISIHPDRIHPDRIHQGIIATPPKNPIFLKLIQNIVSNSPPPNYLYYTKHMFRVLEYLYGSISFTNETEHSRLILFRERLSENLEGTECTKMQAHKLDRYGFCAHAYKNDKSKTPLLIVRDVDYPW